EVEQGVGGSDALLVGDLADRAGLELLVLGLGDLVDEHRVPQRRRHRGALGGVAVVVLDRVAQFGTRRRIAQERDAFGGRQLQHPVPCWGGEVVKGGLVDRHRAGERSRNEHGGDGRPSFGGEGREVGGRGPRTAGAPPRGAGGAPPLGRRRTPGMTPAPPPPSRGGRGYPSPGAAPPPMALAGRYAIVPRPARPACSARAVSSARSATRDGTGRASRSECVGAADDGPAAGPAAIGSWTRARIGSTSALVAARSEASGPITQRRRLEWPI